MGEDSMAKLDNVSIDIQGPFGWPKFEEDLPKLPETTGVYIMTVKNDNGFIPYGVGITRRKWRERFLEHSRKFTSGDYNILDVNEAKKGIRKVAWKGWGWTDEKRIEFEKRKSVVIELAERQLSNTAIFVIDVDAVEAESRMPERLEATIANHYYKDESSLFDRGMLLMPRWENENPITVVFQSALELHGFPVSIEI